MKALTPDDLRDSLANASADVAAQMTMPGLHEIMWDDRDFLGWHDARSSRRAYLATWRDGVPVCLLLRPPVGHARPDVLGICSLCGTQQPASQVKLFTAPKAGSPGEAGSTVGTYICDDFSCSLTIRSARPHDLQSDQGEFIHWRVETLRNRLNAFVGGVLASTA